MASDVKHGLVNTDAGEFAGQDGEETEQKLQSNRVSDKNTAIFDKETAKKHDQQNSSKPKMSQNFKQRGLIEIEIKDEAHEKKDAEVFAVDLFKDLKVNDKLK